MPLIPKALDRLSDWAEGAAKYMRGSAAPPFYSNRGPVPPGIDLGALMAPEGTARVSKARREANRKAFEQMMEVAQFFDDAASLRDYARALGRGAQWQCLMYMAGRQRYSNRRAIHFDDLFWERSIPVGPGGQRAGRYTVQHKSYGYEADSGPESEYEVDLARDLVIPNPWNRKRLGSCLAQIAVPENPWKYDQGNHRIEMWEPLGVGFVTGGNHSIATGIIKGVGRLPASAVVNMRPLYEQVRCEGDRYVRIHDETEVAPVQQAAFGAIYEIGRMLT